MDVIIVSKTHMSNSACVGGILANGRMVRLLRSDGSNHDIDTSLKIGEVYTINFLERNDKKSPHIEDILIVTLNYKFTFSSIAKMIYYLKVKLKIKIWHGNTDLLFDECLLWTNSGSGYISKSGKIPSTSVGFWISDKNLSRNDYNEKVRYSYPIRWRNIPFVGFQNPVEIIPAGTLLRISLARWWTPNDEEERCYLQLSGWYDLPELKSSRVVKYEDDDLPF